MDYNYNTFSFFTEKVRNKALLQAAITNQERLNIERRMGEPGQ